MACHLFGAKPLPEPVVTYCQLDHWEQISVKFNWNFKLFIQENAFEYVICEMMAMFTRVEELLSV